MITSIANQPKLLNDLIEGLAQSAGAASQILHAHRDPRWFVIRDALELAKEGVGLLAVAEAKRYTAVRPA